MPDLILNPTYTVSVRNGSTSKFTTFNWAGPTDNDPPLRLYRCGWKFDLTSLPAGASITGVTLDIDVDGSGAAGNLWSIGPYGGDGAGDIETDAASTIHTGFDVSADNYISNADFTTTGVKNLTLTGAEADLLAQAGGTFCIGCRQNAESVAQTAATLDHATTVPVLTISYTTTPSRSITNIDGDNDVQAGQTNITVTTVGMDSAPTVKTATLGGESFTVVSAGETSWVVSVPLHIDLEWGATHELALTDDTGTVTLAGVTLSAPAGWETVAFTTAPNPTTTESFYEYAQTDTGLGGAGYTMLAGDILAWETQTGLTIDGQTIPQVDPPATVSGSYKIFKDATKTWTSVSTFTVNDLGFPGDPAPVLSSPTGTATGAATASGTVTTDNGTGTLYYYASTNSTETAATIKASGSSQIVGAVGSQGVGVTGLTPETLYYLHYVQDDDGAQESNVVSSSSFTTLATSDVPATSRTSIFQIANYLRSLGTYNSSQCNELVVEWLVSEGITRTQINQMLYGYLGGLGYTGSFNDRLKAWSEDV